MFCNCIWGSHLHSAFEKLHIQRTADLSMKIKKSSNLLGAINEFLLNLGNIQRVTGYKIQLKRVISLFYLKKKKLSRFKLC